MDVERRLDRKEAASFLTAHGYRTAPATLAKLACIGGGRAFESFGRRPLYRETELLAWPQARAAAIDQRFWRSKRARWVHCVDPDYHRT